MATVGKASLTIVPQFDRLGERVSKALAGVDTGSSGAAGGSSYGTSFTASLGSVLGGGAVAGIMASVTSEVTSALANAFSGAVERSDILANYPRVMENLGYSSDDATKSIETMSDRLTGLPTSLSDMVSVVQGIAACTGDLDLSTEAGLALNDMLVASGSSTQLTSAAMEQFRQILAKGTPDMQDWKSLTSAMPGQMNQLAEEMLGAGASADDLYHALGGGGEEATITTDELLRAMIRLDQDGGENMVAFRDQALDATSGIGTSMSNMEIGIERGMANIFEAVGRENITGAISGIGDAFEGALNVVADAIDFIRPLIDGFMDVLDAVGPYAEPAIAALGGFATLSVGVSTGVNALAKAVGNTETFFGPAETMAGKLSDAFWNLAESAEDGSKAEENFMKVGELFSGAGGAGLVAGIGAITAAVAVVAWTFWDAYEKAEAYKSATDGLVDAIDKAIEPTSNLAGAYGSIGEECDAVKKSVSDFRQELDDTRDAHNEMVDSINSRTEELGTSFGLMDSYVDVIDEYITGTDHTKEAQERLKYALDKVNEACGTEYMYLEDSDEVWDNSTQSVLNNSDAIRDNVEALKQNMRQQALLENYDDLWVQYQEDIDRVNELTAKQNEIQEEMNRLRDEGWSDEMLADYQYRLDQVTGELEEAQGYVDADTEALNKLDTQLADCANGTDVFKNRFTAMRGDVNARISEMCGDVDTFAQRLVDAGVSSTVFADMSAEDFDRLYDECSGDVELMIGKLQEYNDVELEPKEASLYVDPDSIDVGLTAIDQWNKSSLKDLEGTLGINLTTNVAGEITDLGGLRLHAAGGILPYTTTTAGIATMATPLDIVGEAGAEAIVPLTNREYSLPFAQLIAEEISELENVGGGDTYVYNTYFDGIELNQSDGQDLLTLINKYHRLAMT